MKNRAGELAAAASEIDPQHLEAAKAAISVNCLEYLRWAERFSQSLESVQAAKLHKFARAFSLTLLGHLPTRPETCPFCLQYGRDKNCRGCGYAATHGRCDADDSAFSLFIESFQELGRAIYQDTGGLSSPADDARGLLNHSIQSSRDRARQLQEALSSASALQLMELKAGHLDAMIKLLPEEILSEEVSRKRRLVEKMLLDYW